MGYLFRESIVIQLHLYHLKSIFYLFKLLKCIHMVSLITVHNGNVGQFILISIFSILAHLIYLLIELNESFITLSVLIHLVCLVTEPNGFISSDNTFYIVCLFIPFWCVWLHYWMWSMFRYIISPFLCNLLPWLPWFWVIIVSFYGNSIYYLLFITLTTMGFITLATKGFP